MRVLLYLVWRSSTQRQLGWMKEESWYHRVAVMLSCWGQKISSACSDEQLVWHCANVAFSPLVIFTLHLKWHLSCSHFHCATLIWGLKSGASISRESISEGKGDGQFIGAGQQQGSNNLETSTSLLYCIWSHLESWPHLSRIDAFVPQIWWWGLYSVELLRLHVSRFDLLFSTIWM